MAGFGGSSSPCKLSPPLLCLLLCLLALGPSWGGFPGWLRTISLLCCPGTQEWDYPSTLLLLRVKYWLQVFVFF